MATDIRKTKTKIFAKFDGAPTANARSTPESEPATPSRHSIIGLGNDAPHAGDVTSGLADARDRVGDRFDRDRHVEGIGVNKCGVIARDRDMAFPEYQIAALWHGGPLPSLPRMRRRVRVGDGGAERPLLHVAVARTGDAARRQRHLHQPGAIEAERGLAAP